MDIEIKLEGINEAFATLANYAALAGRGTKRALFRVGTLVRDTAREYAPRSPTDTDKKAAAKAAGKKRRKRKKKSRATHVTKPGGLERSLEFEVGTDDVEVFIADNSEAGPYGFIIHEEKGTKWQRRGIGTVSKGSKADDKFITRAIVDEEDNIIEIILDEQAKAIQGA